MENREQDERTPIPPARYRVTVEPLPDFPTVCPCGEDDCGHPPPEARGYDERGSVVILGVGNALEDDERTLGVRIFCYADRSKAGYIGAVAAVAALLEFLEECALLEPAALHNLMKTLESAADRAAAGGN